MVCESNAPIEERWIPFTVHAYRDAYGDVGTRAGHDDM